MQIKYRLLLHFLILFVLTGVISISALLYTAQKEAEIDFQRTLKQQNKLLECQIQNKTKEMQALSSVILENKDIVNAFESRNLDNLKSLVNPIYSVLLQSNISHFYFILPDKRVFLRVHNQDLANDKINRFILDKAAKTAAISSGAEVGIESNIVLRLALPIYKNDTLIGYLELGQDFNHLFDEAAQILNTDTTLLVEKSRINIQTFKKKAEKNPNKFRELENYYILASSLDNTDIITNTIANSQTQTVMPDELLQSKNDEPLNTLSVNFKDASGAIIGKIVFTQKINHNTFEDVVHIILVATLVVLAFSSVIFFSYFRYTNRLACIIQQQKEKLELKATTDSLTGLFNRRYFDNVINTKLSIAKRFNQISVFIMIDIDNFKLYNDNYGHYKGDEVLINVSKALLKYCKRSTDVVVRMGGEEFGIYSMFENNESIDNYINLILQEIRELRILHSFNAPYSIITASIGYSTREIDSEKSFGKMYEEADTALYISKSKGKNRATKFEDISNKHI